MIKGKTIRKLVGFFAFFILLTPFLGLPQDGKDILIIGFSLLILGLLVYKPVLREMVHLFEELSLQKKQRKAKAKTTLSPQSASTGKKETFEDVSVKTPESSAEEETEEKTEEKPRKQLYVKHAEENRDESQEDSQEDKNFSV